MPFFDFLKEKMSKETIFNSKLSEKVRPVFEDAYAICAEFGSEEGKYYDYRYKNKIIDVTHTSFGDNINAFGSGKEVTIVFKEKPVFDCTIKTNGTIVLKLFEAGDWENYFEVLKKRVRDTKDASKMCSELYALMSDPGLKNIVSKRESYFHKPPNYNKRYIKDEYTYKDGRIEIVFLRDDDTVASSAKIRYRGREVFDAVHHYPSDRRPQSSNTRCDLYKRGEWENYIRELKAKYNVR